MACTSADASADELAATDASAETDGWTDAGADTVGALHAAARSRTAGARARLRGDITRDYRDDRRKVHEPLVETPGDGVQRRHVRVQNRITLIALLLVLLATAVLAGGYLDWIWWHPTKGIIVTLAAGALLLLAGGLAVARRPLTNRLALGAAALGLGLLIGQAVGPSREPTELSAGTITIRFDSPVPSSATGRADCQTVPSGEHLLVSGDVNTRLSIPEVDPAHSPTIVTSVSFGDMWAPDAGRRDDEVVVAIYGNSAIIAADGSPTEVRAHSTPSSSLDVARNGNSGTISFSGLTVSEGQVGAVLGSDGEVSGSIEWTCPE
jgi:hypothetical protein